MTSYSQQPMTDDDDNMMTDSSTTMTAQSSSLPFLPPPSYPITIFGFFPILRPLVGSSILRPPVLILLPLLQLQEPKTKTTVRSKDHYKMLSHPNYHLLSPPPPQPVVVLYLVPLLLLLLLLLSQTPLLGGVTIGTFPFPTSLRLAGVAQVLVVIADRCGSTLNFSPHAFGDA